MGRKKGVQKPQAEISKIKHVQDEDMTLKLKEVELSLPRRTSLYKDKSAKKSLYKDNLKFCVCL